MAGIWPGMPFVHVHMAGHARIRVRGVSPYVWSVLRPRAWGDGLFRDNLVYVLMVKHGIVRHIVNIVCLLALCGLCGDIHVLAIRHV